MLKRVISEIPSPEALARECRKALDLHKRDSEDFKNAVDILNGCFPLYFVITGPIRIYPEDTRIADGTLLASSQKYLAQVKNRFDILVQSRETLLEHPYVRKSEIINTNLTKFNPQGFHDVLALFIEKVGLPVEALQRQQLDMVLGSHHPVLEQMSTALDVFIREENNLSSALLEKHRQRMIAALGISVLIFMSAAGIGAWHWLRGNS